MKIVLKPLMTATAVSAMLAVGCGEEEETTKVVEDDTATSQGSEEPLPVLASNPELPKDRAYSETIGRGIDQYFGSYRYLIEYSFITL
ncbi:MAG: hypothetical protein HOA16_05360 [Opitutae bacterium]|nr:hypothetical protein [Opitutae bacterium]